MPNRSRKFSRRHRWTRDDAPEPLHRLLVRVLAVMACTVMVAGAMLTSLAIFWRAAGSQTALEASFATWSDDGLIMLGGGLLLAAIGAVGLVRWNLE
ncbi:hypothetical protein C7401_15437 [Paraburkholderia unamae]|nr:hypothetical protein C7401_15437 [Paraburkholderia unamae]